MQNSRVFWALGAGVAAVVVACGSSSSSNPTTAPTQDAGDDSTTITEADDSSAAATCIPLGSVGCSQGMECCLDLSAGLMPGTCVQAGSCTSSVSIACESGNDCTGGQVCCADFGGGSLAAIEDGGLAALGIDASALSLDSGTGININFKVSCAASCTSSQIQACSKSSECAGGAPCVSITSLLGDGGAGLGGDAGIPASFAMYASALGMVMACEPLTPDAAAVPEAGSEAGPVDAQVPTDAPSDALSE
jgi:hypothetical protein